MCDDNINNHRARGGLVLHANGQIQWLGRDELHLLLVDLGVK